MIPSTPCDPRPYLGGVSGATVSVTVTVEEVSPMAASSFAPQRHQPVGWRLVPGEPAGTLGWWEGDEVVAFAVWTSDHWVYVTDIWSGPNPPPGVLPDRAADPRASGWWQAPDGQWHEAPPPPTTAWRAGPWLTWVLIVVVGFFLLLFMLLVLITFMLVASGM